MAKDRRDRDERELALGLQEVEVTPPVPAPESARGTDADLFGNEEVPLEQRMMFAVEMLQTLSQREQLAVIAAVLPNLLADFDVAGRSAVIDELVLNLAPRPLA